MVVPPSRSRNAKAECICCAKYCSTTCDRRGNQRRSRCARRCRLENSRALLRAHQPLSACHAESGQKDGETRSHDGGDCLCAFAQLFSTTHLSSHDEM